MFDFRTTRLPYDAYLNTLPAATTATSIFAPQPREQSELTDCIYVCKVELTALASFCEEDYILTGWLAEAINTISTSIQSRTSHTVRDCTKPDPWVGRLTMPVIYAINGLRRSRFENPSLSSQSIYGGLALVGICSALFHGTLRFSTQMADDTSMLLASSCVLYKCMTFRRSEAFTRWFTSALVFSVGVVLAYHYRTDENVVHELAFVCIIAGIALRSRQLLRSGAADEKIQQHLPRRTGFGAGCFVIGYFLWQIDFTYCPQLTAIKRYVGMPWSFLFELHAWWHILTALGAYTFMAIVEDVTVDGRKK